MNALGKFFSILALCAVASMAGGDDGSMNPRAGESRAALQGGGHHLGEYKPKITVRLPKRGSRRPWVGPDKDADTRIARDGQSGSGVEGLRDDSAT
jgi:hypothetical protein